MIFTLPSFLVRGGRTEVYGCHWSKENFPDEIFEVYDLNSSYGHILGQLEFPTGPYEILCGI